MMTKHRLSLPRRLCRARQRSPQRGRQHGFAYIAAVVLLVIMATLATAMVRLTTAQQAMSNQDLLGARAGQAARAGVEWGLFQLRGATPCAATTTLTDFRALTGFTVTVTCSANEYNEGELAPGTPWRKRIYTISAIACNIGDNCPSNDNVVSVDYVERRRVVSACLTVPTTPGAPTDCY